MAERIVLRGRPRLAGVGRVMRVRLPHEADYAYLAALTPTERGRLLLLGRLLAEEPERVARAVLDAVNCGASVEVAVDVLRKFVGGGRP